MNGRRRWATLAVVALCACGMRPSSGDGGDVVGEVSSTDGSDAPSTDTIASNCPARSMATRAQLPGITEIALAAAGDFNGDGRTDLAVSFPGGGIATFLASPCGELFAGSRGLEGVVLTGLDVAPLASMTSVDIVALRADRQLLALAGTDLHELWSASLTQLTDAGPVVSARLAADGRVHVAAFDASTSALLRVQNTGSGWMVRARVTLPPGIARVRAGDLGGNARDELLFLGGGLVEVVSVADFDFSDVRFLSMSASSAAAFGDFNADTNGDAVIASRTMAVLWTGDGSTRITMRDGYRAAAEIVELVTLDREGDRRPEVGLLDANGDVQILARGATAFAMGETASFGSDVTQLISGDVDGDGHGDLVGLTAGGAAVVWRAP